MEDEIARFDEEEQDEIMKMLLEEQKLNVFGLIGMILSILSYPAFLLCFIFAGGFAGFFQLLVAIPALVLGIIGVTRKNRKKNKKARNSLKPRSKASGKRSRNPPRPKSNRMIRKNSIAL